VLAFGYVVALLASVDDLGYARDEGFYFQAARAYEEWLVLLVDNRAQALDQVDSYWRVNHEHPALIKTLFALSHIITFNKLELFSHEGTSYRFAGMVVSGLGVGLVYLWGTRAQGRLAGLVAALSLAAMPRFFFHAHLACFDAPVVTMWTLCAYCWWRSLGRSHRMWSIAVGISFGLALNTKHNSWFIPIVCVAHALLLQVPAMAHGIDRAALRRRAVRSLVAMATIGPLLFLATWPWLWTETGTRLQQYALFHLHHVYYNMEFLGRNYFEPPMPRGYAFVMTAATVPTITLLLFVLGVGRSAWRDWRVPVNNLLRYVWGARKAPTPKRVEPAHGAAADPATTLLWLLAIAVQYAAWLRPTTPIFGGTKHWMTAYPFVALFAGSALAATVRYARAKWRSSRLAFATRLVDLELAFAVSVLVAPVVETAHSHPWALSSYSPIVGGASGGATLGLNRGFWGYTTGAVTPYLNDAAASGSRLYIHDTALPAWDMLRRDGRVRRDIRGVWGVVGSDLSLYHHEKHMAVEEHQAWIAYGTRAPVHIAGIDGVPVVWIYRRPSLSH